MHSPQSFHSACTGHSDAEQEQDLDNQSYQEKDNDNDNDSQIDGPIVAIRTADTEETDNHNLDNDKEGPQQQSQQRCFALRHPIQYLCSPNGKELMASGIVSLIFLASSYLLDDPIERPIPYQYIEQIDTYVLNLSHNHDSNGDTIPDWVIAVLATVVCPCLQMLLSYFVSSSGQDLHRTVCVYLLTLSLNDAATWALKSYMGILRPDYYHLCQPNETYEYCTGESDDGQFEIGGAFPSGHASFTFCGLTLLYLYLERTFGISSVQQAVVLLEDPSTVTTTKRRSVGLEYTCTRSPTMYRMISILCGLPLALGSFLVATRIADNRHHPSDIVAGSLLGAFIAYFFHVIWYVSCS